MFTDGVGLTSQSVVDACAKTLSSKSTNLFGLFGKMSVDGDFSAVQVRVGGAKGMLVAWPPVEGNEVWLRPSMEKFVGADMKIGAVKVLPFYLFYFFFFLG